MYGPDGPYQRWPDDTCCVRFPQWNSSRGKGLPLAQTRKVSGVRRPETLVPWFCACLLRRVQEGAMAPACPMSGLPGSTQDATRRVLPWFSGSGRRNSFLSSPSLGDGTMASRLVTPKTGALVEISREKDSGLSGAVMSLVPSLRSVWSADLQETNSSESFIQSEASTG
jgi:hypothetical protein